MRKWVLAAAILLIHAMSNCAGGEAAEDGEFGRLTFQGVQRTYFLHMPASPSGTQPIPLVLAFHGGQGNSLQFSQMTGLNPVADKYGFAVAYPDSIEYWRDGRDTTASNIDDVGFVRALIDHLVNTKNISRRQVYATGASNGGMMTLRLACDASDQIAAFAPVIASIPVAYRDKCKPARTLAIMLTNGTSDPFMPWEGGAIKSGAEKGAGGNVIPVPDTVDFWRQHDGCWTTPQVEALPDLDKNDGTQVQWEKYQECKDGSVVQFVKIIGGGHTWPGSPLKPSPMEIRIVGNTSYDISASEMILRFFNGRWLP